MNTSDIINRMSNGGVRLYLLPNGRLQYEAATALTTEQQNFITKNSQAIVEHLKSSLAQYPDQFVAGLLQREVFDIDQVINELCFLVQYHEGQQPDTQGKLWRAFFKRFIEEGSRMREQYQYLNVDNTCELMTRVYEEVVSASS